MSDTTETRSATVDPPTNITSQETRVFAKSAIIDANNDGIPDTLQKIVDSVPDFAPSWNNRRKVVILALLALGFAFIAATISILACVVAQGVFGMNAQVSGDVADMVQTLLWVIATTAMAIIGSYSFGANLDYSSYRNSLTDLAGKLRGPRTAPPA